jgi:hypothetical protein
MRLRPASLKISDVVAGRCPIALISRVSRLRVRQTDDLVPRARARVMVAAIDLNVADPENWSYGTVLADRASRSTSEAAVSPRRARAWGCQTASLKPSIGFEPFLPAMASVGPAIARPLRNSALGDSGRVRNLLYGSAEGATYRGFFLCRTHAPSMLHRYTQRQSKIEQHHWDIGKVGRQSHAYRSAAL